MLTAVFPRNPQVKATFLQAPMATNQNAPLTGNKSSPSSLTLEFPSQQSIPPNTYIYTPETQLRDATPKTRFKEEVVEHVITDYDNFEYNIPEIVPDPVDDILQTSSMTSPMVSFQEPVSVASHVFAAVSVSGSFLNSVPLNDLFESDIESSDMGDPEEYAPPIPEPSHEDIVSVPSRPIEEPLSDFCLALALWCDKEGIKHRSYDGLIEVLRLLDSPEIEALPQKLATLLKWCRKRLPLPEIQKASLPICKDKQPTGRGNLTIQFIISIAERLSQQCCLPRIVTPSILVWQTLPIAQVSFGTLTPGVLRSVHALATMQCIATAHLSFHPISSSMFVHCITAAKYMAATVVKSVSLGATDVPLLQH
jgi:hypothetical protein